MTIITLPFPPSVNNLFLNGRNGRFRSQKYDEWIHLAWFELKRQQPLKVIGPVSIKYEFQDGRDNRKRDLGNLLKAPEDILVSFGVIEADNNSIVREISMSWAKDVEGVRITIESLGAKYAARAGNQSEAGGVSSTDTD